MKVDVRTMSGDMPPKCGFIHCRTYSLGTWPLKTMMVSSKGRHPCQPKSKIGRKPLDIQAAPGQARGESFTNERRIMCLSRICLQGVM